MGDHQMGSNWMAGSPVTEGSNEVGKGKFIKGDRSRRSWTDREKATLLLALKDLVAHGWKTDNGFRAGYLTRVEEAMKREFPKTDLKVNPHILSKITTWKKNYYSLIGILARSGVGFNANGDFKIDCDDEQWAQIIQKDGNARYMRNKSWPHWNAWTEIYGKDRAGGGRALDSAETIKKANSVVENVADNAGTDYHMTFEELFPDEVLPEGVLPEVLPEGVLPSIADESHCNSEGNTPKMTKKSSKKRKADDPMERVIDMMDRMQNATNDHLKTLSSRIGYEFDLSAKRTKVFDLLGVISGLTLKHKFYVGQKLVKEPELMDFFMGLPEIGRSAYVMFILESDGIN